MTNKPKQLIIIGGGPSLKPPIEQGLWSILKNRFTFGLNYSYNYFPESTAQLYVDNDFYHKEIMQGLANHPLVIGKYHKDLTRPNIINDNTLMLSCIDTHHRDISAGTYKSSLCGLFALTLGIYLLDVGEIFLLGYDYGATGKDTTNRPLTHFYQGKIKHRGIGKINYYTSDRREERDFGPYKSEQRVKIYNVGLNSNITIFPKLSYDEFYDKLKGTYDQKELQQQIIIKLNSIAKWRYNSNKG